MSQLFLDTFTNFFQEIHLVFKEKIRTNTVGCQKIKIFVLYTYLYTQGAEARFYHKTIDQVQFIKGNPN